MRDERAAFDAARAICKRHARSFYFASHFLPREKREAAYAVYAFCRMLDDAVDEAEAGTEAKRLAEFRATLDAAYAGIAPSPGTPGEGGDEGVSACENLEVKSKATLTLALSRNTGRGDQKSLALRAFQITVARFEIPKQHFLDLARGCEMDLTISRYATWDELKNYCYHVAGVVGLMMCRVFGLGDSSAEPRAVAMGNAMQLTNILRDVREDLERGRIYLPGEDLERFGVTEGALRAGRVDAAFTELMRFEIARARAMFREGAAGLAALPLDGSRQTAAAMAVIYSGILNAIERQNYDVFSARARVSTFGKLLRLRIARRVWNGRELYGAFG